MEALKPYIENSLVVLLNAKTIVILKFKDDCVKVPYFLKSIVLKPYINDILEDCVNTQTIVKQ